MNEERRNATGRAHGNSKVHMLNEEGEPVLPQRILERKDI